MITSKQISDICTSAGAARTAVIHLDSSGKADPTRFDDCSEEAADNTLCVEDTAWEYFERWRADGHGADMDWLGNYPEIRRQPSLLLPGARTMIVTAFTYSLSNADAIGCAPPDSLIPTSHDRLSSAPADTFTSVPTDTPADTFTSAPSVPSDPYIISAYALGDDYHDALRRRLQEALSPLRASEGGEWRICIDSAPLMERYWALRSGLGVQGRNGTVIIPSLGAPVLLATVLTTLSIEDARTPIPLANAAQCLNCSLCVKACPGEAISPVWDGGLFEAPDASRCLSYLTIEMKCQPSEEQRRILTSPIGSRTLYGCDICQRVCPMLRPAAINTDIPEFAPREAYHSLTLSRIKEMSDEKFAETFRRSPMKRAKHRLRRQ